jgi:aspartate oxidase
MSDQPSQSEAVLSASATEEAAQPEIAAPGLTEPENERQEEDSANSDTAAIRAQVEKEHALADVQKRLKELEGALEKLKREKKEVEDEKNGAGMSNSSLN